MLGGVYVHDQWLAEGKTTWARCRSQDCGFHPAGSPAPAGGCSCGLYAMHPWAVEREKSLADRSMTMVRRAGTLDVVGLIEAWGTVHVHREGFRAEFARPASLFLVGMPRDSDYARLVENLAIAYRVGVTEVDGPREVSNYCREHGFGMDPRVVGRLLDQ